jgi:hypothetical protein
VPQDALGLKSVKTSLLSLRGPMALCWPGKILVYSCNKMQKIKTILFALVCNIFIKNTLQDMFQLLNCNSRVEI